jgi:uncharacterized YigZ family protein
VASKEDTYKTISTAAEGFTKDRGSKFYAYAYPVLNIDQVEAAQAVLRKQHNKARHHCYAYRLGTDGNNFRANDDGEPSGTAGKPILGQIDKNELCDVLVVVVRYFGGTLLGTGGLIQAYRKATEDALHQANIVEKIITKKYKLDFDYSLMAPIMNAIKKQNIHAIEQSFTESAYIVISFPASEAQKSLIQLKANVLGISFDQVNIETKIGGLKITDI